MDKINGRCWKPVHRAPVLPKTDVFLEEDLVVLKRLQEKYRCTRFPCEIFGISDFRDIKKPKLQVIKRDNNIKQEPVTPNVIPFFNPNNTQASARVCDRFVPEAHSYEAGQLLQHQSKKDNFLQNAVKGETEQQYEIKFPEQDIKTNLMCPQPYLQTIDSRQKTHLFSRYEDNDQNINCHRKNELKLDTFDYSFQSPSLARPNYRSSDATQRYASNENLRDDAQMFGYENHIENMSVPGFQHVSESSNTGFLNQLVDKECNSIPKDVELDWTNCQMTTLSSQCYLTTATHASSWPHKETQNKPKSASRYSNAKALVSESFTSGSAAGKGEYLKTKNVFDQLNRTAVFKSPSPTERREHFDMFNSPSVASTTQQSTPGAPGSPTGFLHPGRPASAWHSAPGHSLETSVRAALVDAPVITPWTLSARASSAFVISPVSLATQENKPSSEVFLQPFAQVSVVSREDALPGKIKSVNDKTPGTKKTKRPHGMGSKDDLFGGGNLFLPVSVDEDSRKRISAAVTGNQCPKKKVAKSSREKITEKLKAIPGESKNDRSAGKSIKESPTLSKKAATKTLTETPEKREDLAADQAAVGLQDVCSVSQQQRQQLGDWLHRYVGTVSLLVLYEDNSTNIDSSLPKEKQVKGIVLHCEKGTFLLPTSDDCDTSTLQWIRCAVKTLLKNDKIVKVAINCKQLVIALLKSCFLEDCKGMIGLLFEDPIVAGWLLNPDCPPNTLRALCKTTGVTRDKDEGPQADLVAVETVMEKLRSGLEEEGLWRLFQNMEMPLTPLLAAMELRPVRVDVHAFLTFSDVLKKKLSKVERQAHEIAGHPFCINSTLQLRQLLYEELKLDQKLPGSKKVTRTATAHHKSTSEPMLRQMIPFHPLPSVVLEYRHLLKLKSTYVDSMLEALQGESLHTHWEQTSAATGRLASSHPNMQAIPKTSTTITDYEDNFIVGCESKSFEIYAREPYICNEGNVFLAADFQQIELRLLAHLTNDPELKKMFHSKDKSADVFIHLTAQWLSKPCDEVNHAEREQTKRIVYSIMYGVGKEKLSEYLKVSTSRATDIMDSFLVTFPAIQVFTRKCINYARQHGYTETVMGRRRWFPKVNDQAAHSRAQAERQAVNFCVQGSAADLCKQAMLRAEEALIKVPHLSARLLIHIHDELVWELPKDQLKETCDLIKLVMEDHALLCQPLLPGLRVPITVSLSSGTSWAHLKPCVFTVPVV